MRRLLPVMLIVGCFAEGDLPSDESTSSTNSTNSPSTTSTTTTDVSESSSEVSSSTTEDPDGSTSSSGQTVDPDSSSSTTAEPVSDWALYFDGSATMESTEAIDLMLSDDFTVEAWVRIDSADAHGTIAQHRGVGTTGWSLSIESMQSTFVFGFYDNNGQWHEVVGDDLADLEPGWHHVSGTKNGTSLFFHVDGDVSATSACAQNNSGPVVPLQIGTSDDDPLIYIAVDDVRISSIARYQSPFNPPTEIAADPSTRVLVLSDEGEGSATFDSTSSITFDLQGITWTPGNTEA